MLLKNKRGEDQESIQTSTTPDLGYQWESDNFTIRHHISLFRCRLAYIGWLWNVNVQSDHSYLFDMTWPQIVEFAKFKLQQHCL